MASVSQPFLGSRPPYLVMKVLGGTPCWFYRYKEKEIVIIGGTPGTSPLFAVAPRLGITALGTFWYFLSNFLRLYCLNVCFRTLFLLIFDLCRPQALWLVCLMNNPAALVPNHFFQNVSIWRYHISTIVWDWRCLTISKTCLISVTTISFLSYQTSLAIFIKKTLRFSYKVFWEITIPASSTRPTPSSRATSCWRSRAWPSPFIR